MNFSQDEKERMCALPPATIIEEHGVGKLTCPWLVDEVGYKAVELGQRIQFALDPDGIFNPDFLFEESIA